MPTTAHHRYDLKPPLDWGPDLDHQFFLQNELWNRLVAIERTYQAAQSALLGTDSTVGPLEAKMEIAQLQRANLAEERRALRQVDRRRDATDEIDVRIRTVAMAIRRLGDQLRSARRLERANAKAPTAAVEERRHAAVVAACEESGLSRWDAATVLEAHDAARERSVTNGAILSPRVFAGEGRLVHRFEVPVSVTGLFEGRCEHVALERSLQSTQECATVGGRNPLRALLTVTAYVRDGAPRIVQFPIVMYRPLPATADVREVVVVRRRLDARWIWSAVFVVREHDRDSLARNDIRFPVPAKALAPVGEASLPAPCELPAREARHELQEL